MLRILHTADWQIGRQYSRFELEDAAALAEARFKAIEKLAALATEHHADLLVVAGDVFDSQTLSDRNLRRSFNAMADFTGPWLLLPGNHDAALSESVWTRARRLNCIPDYVHVLDTPELFLLDSLKLAVLPAPLTQRQTYQDLSDWFDQAESPAGYWRLGLAHGSVSGVLEHLDSHNLIDQNRVQRAKLDYLALGDWHGTVKINERCYYSGTPEPDRFRDNDSGQALLVEISEPGATPVVQALPVAQHPWRSIQHQLNDDTELDLLERELNALTDQSVVELELSGQLSLSGFERLESILGQTQGRCRAWDCQREALRLAPSEEDLDALHADGYLQAALKQLQELRHGSQQQAAEDALLILAGLLRDKEGGHAH